ncbi:hypothetical protein ACF0H5_008697 [Mactra antiquata]
MKRTFRTLLYICTAILVILLLYCYCKDNNRKIINKQQTYHTSDRSISFDAVNHEEISEQHDLKIYPPFQPEVISEFPTVEGSEPRIPHIIHQTYTGIFVPVQYTMFAEKIAKMHPSWKYYFWTDDSARKLLVDKYQWLLPVWDKMTLSIHRGDLLRYVVLYEFGGLYLDMDVDTLIPLDPVMMKYACIIPTEPFEHNVFIYKRTFFMTNAIMFCRPKHPFFKSILDTIRDMNLTYNHVVMDTGPGLVTRVFTTYNNINISDINRTRQDTRDNSPYFYRGERSDTDNDAVYVPNTHYFSDTLDVNLQEQNFKLICRKFNEQNYLTRRACVDMERRGIVRKHQEYNILVHKWYHYWKYKLTDIERLLKKNIKDFVPHLIIY